MPPTDNLAALLRQCLDIYEEKLERGDWPWGHVKQSTHETRHTTPHRQLPLILPEHPLSEQQDD